MGSNLCSCSSDCSAESFFYETLNSSCLTNLNDSDLDNILYLVLDGDSDFITKKNLQITEKKYEKICGLILSDSYIKLRTSSKTSLSVERDKLLSIKYDNQSILSKFLLNLFNLFNINNNVNVLIFKLIMLPFLMKDNMEDKHKTEIFFDYLKVVNFKDKNANLIVNDIHYGQFVETLTLYFAIILSGFTKVFCDCLESINNKTNKNNKNNKNVIIEGIIEEFKEELKLYFTPENIREYYINISKQNLTLKYNKLDDDLNNQLITKTNFESFIDKNKCLLNYWKLRKDFMQFVDNKNIQNFS